MGKVKLFCIPFAGGTAMTYWKWKKELEQNLNIFPIELLGRGVRYAEGRYNNFNEAIDDVYNIIVDNLEEKEKWAIFGHSMGSKITFEVCNKIIERGLKEPCHIIFSGGKVPYETQKVKVVHKMLADEFKEEIMKLGGTPQEVFDDKNLFNYFEPIIRSDYKIMETYQTCKKDCKFNIDISVFYGEEDKMNYDDAIKWKQYSNKDFNVYKFKGGHFFINDDFNEVMNTLEKIFSIY